MLFIFDMGGVVTTTATLERMFDYLKMSKDEFYKICENTAPDIFNQLSINEISVEQFWKEFNNRTAILKKESPVVKTDLFRLYFHPQLNEETVALIKDLRKKHRVVCGTNTIQSHWENHLERGDYSYFDQTYASNKIGFAKPDVKYWQTIMMAEGYNPEQTFFTDDRADNCDAAKSLGINVHQFIDAKDLRKAWSKYL